MHPFHPSQNGICLATAPSSESYNYISSTSLSLNVLLSWNHHPAMS
jgi:hypothetical protein